MSSPERRMDLPEAFLFLALVIIVFAIFANWYFGVDYLCANYNFWGNACP